MGRLILLTFIIITLTFPVLAQEKGINFFQGTWAEALEAARQHDKPIFVDAYAVWCGPCKWMASNVFTQEDVGSYFNENYINYKFDMEKGEGRIFAGQYKIAAYPTLLFIDKDGKVVHRIVGARAAEQFIEEGRKARAYFN